MKPIPTKVRKGNLNLKCMEMNRWEPHRNFPAMTGRLWQAVHWLRKGLADYNPSSANPSDVGANNAYHDPPPRVVARELAKAPSRQEANKSSRCQHRAGAVFRASPASLAWAGTYPHGCMQLSRCDERLFPRSPYSRRERVESIMVSNIFPFFSEMRHAQIYSACRNSKLFPDFLAGKTTELQIDNLQSRVAFTRKKT